MLRCCKYSIEECVSVFKGINDDGNVCLSLYTTRKFTSIPTLLYLGVLDYSETGLLVRDPIKNLTEKKLQETVRAKIMQTIHKLSAESVY